MKTKNQIQGDRPQPRINVVEFEKEIYIQPDRQRKLRVELSIDNFSKEVISVALSFCQ